MAAPLVVYLAVDERMALRRFAAQRGIHAEKAAEEALREFLTQGGWMNWNDAEEDEPPTNSV